MNFRPLRLIMLCTAVSVTAIAVYVGCTPTPNAPALPWTITTVTPDPEATP